jgi:hypothetical protein
MIAHVPDRIHEEWNTSDMVKVGMGYEDVVDLTHLGQAQTSHARACVDQNVIVHQEGRSVEIAAYAAATAKDPKLHRKSLQLESSWTRGGQAPLFGGGFTPGVTTRETDFPT